MKTMRRTPSEPFYDFFLSIIIALFAAVAAGTLR